MVNPDEGTGTLSPEDAVEALLATGEPDEANSQADDDDAPEPQSEDAPDPVKTEPEDVDNEDQDGEEPEEFTDDEDQGEGEGEDEDETFFTVKVDGEELQVNQAELIEGYQRETDYRNKTAALADQRREVEAKQAQVDQLAAIFQQQLNQFVPQLQAHMQNKWADIDWDTLSREDPTAYVQLRHEFEADMSATQQAQQEFEAVNRHRAEQAKHTQHQKVLAELEPLQEAIPEFSDPKSDVAKAKKQEIVDYLAGQGFSNEEIMGIADHRALVVVNKAIAYDKAKKSAATKKNAARNVPKVQKSGKTRRLDPKAEKAKGHRARLKQSGSVDDAVNLLLTEG